MRNVQTLNTAVLILIVVSYTIAASETRPADTEDDIRLKWSRQSKKSKTKSESVKKEKQQHQEKSEAVTRPHLTPSLSQTVSAADTLAPPQDNAEPMRNLLQNVPFEMRHMNNPFRYAYNYPYQKYPLELFSPNSLPGYLYDNPAVSLSPLQHVNKDVIIHPANGQQPYINEFAPNLMGFGSGQPGPIKRGQPNSQLAVPPSFHNNFISYGPIPYGQPKLPHKIAAKPVMPFDYSGIYGNKFMGSASLTGGLSTGHLFQPSQLPQSSVLSPLPGMVHFGVLPENDINGVRRGPFSDFIRGKK